MSAHELNALFYSFDRNQDGNVDYNEFLRSIVGGLNDFRRNYVQQAFQILDRDGSGQIAKHDITGVFNTSQHPDVVQGRKTEEEVLTDFLDTFEIHSSYTHPGSYDHKVTFDEFLEYYSNVSANIDDD